MQKLRIFVRSSIRQEKAVRKPIAEFKANSKLTGLHSECIQFYVLRSIKASISLALIAFSAYSKGGDWPNWRGPSHDGFSTETAWSLEKAEVVWKKHVGVGFSSMSVVDNLVYTQGHDGRKKGGKETVYCLSAKTGEVVWSDEYPAAIVDYLHEGGPCATPTVYSGRLYTISKDGRLKCFNALNGKVIWERNMMKAAGMRKPPEWGFAGSPYVLNDKLLIEGGYTFALDLESGKDIWRSESFRHAYGTPATFTHKGKSLIATLKTDGLVILDASDGSTLAFRKWETSFRTNSTTPIPLSDGRIFISTGYRRGSALLQLKGDGLQTIWENKNLSNHMNNSVIYNGHIYGFDGNTHMAGPKEMVCLELATGTVKWRAGAALRCGSLMAADNRMLALGERGQLIEAPLSPEGFEPTVEIQALTGKCWTVPVLANARIYARNAKGTLVCVNASK